MVVELLVERPQQGDLGERFFKRRRGREAQAEVCKTLYGGSNPPVASKIRFIVDG